MSFKGALQAFADKTTDNFRNVTKKVLFDISVRIVERTPVGDASLWKSKPPPGYVGGRARGSWQYSIDEPSDKDIKTIDPTGAQTLGSILASINPVPGRHYITSNLVYMPRLEDGWSGQAPRGMVSLVAVEFQDIVDVAVGTYKHE